MSDKQPSYTRVIVVDDDHVFLRLMDGFLSQLSCRTEFFDNGRDAVAYLRENLVDICFMDIMMPVMGGIEATQIIRDEVSKILPIIAIASSSMIATKDKCLDVGMNDYIVKPVSFETIRDAIARQVTPK